MKISKQLVFWWLVSLIPLAGIAIGLLRPDEFSAAQSKYSLIVESFGPLGWLGLILVQVLQVVITPLNHYIVGLVGGFLFGAPLGGLLNWVGRVLGHVCAYLIAHYAGRRLVERFIGASTLEKYDKIVAPRAWLLFLLYFLPFFPDDELSYLAGLSSMRFPVFLLANLLGHVGGSWSLSYVGAGVESYDPFFWVLIGLTIAGFPVVLWLARRGPKS